MLMMIEAMGNHDCPLLDIDLIDFPCKKMDTAQHLACWIYNRCEIKIAGRHLVKHRCEQEKVLTINEGDFDGRVPRELLLQRHSDGKTRKAPAENKYPFSRCIFHRSPLTWR